MCTGVTIGKGFAGTIKRHTSRRTARRTVTPSHNVPGSIGMAQDPGRVFPGKRMAGHTATSSARCRTSRVVRVDVERQLLLIKGAVPGAKGGDVVVRPAVKA
jgi:large subunit ribosomal protein L3